MFDRGVANADNRHRRFFDRAGDVRQVWAKRPVAGRDDELFFLADEAVNDDIRDACYAERLLCPLPQCPDPRFIARGGEQRRHHFAHRVSEIGHQPAAVRRHQALVMLAEWATKRYAGIEFELDDSTPLSIVAFRSQRSGRTIRVGVTYDRRFDPTVPAGVEQVVVGNTRGILLPRAEADRPEAAWWCDESQLAGWLLTLDGYALAIDPEERLVGTLIHRQDAVRMGIAARGASRLLCVVDALDDCALGAQGLETPLSRKVTEVRERERAEEAERQRRLADAAARRRVRNDPSRPPERASPLLARQPARDSKPPPSAATAWPTDPSSLRRLLHDDVLAERLSHPLPSDVKCELPHESWHLLAAVALKDRDWDAHPAAIRAALTVNGCGVRITVDAVRHVMDIIAQHRATGAAKT